MTEMKVTKIIICDVNLKFWPYCLQKIGQPAIYDIFAETLLDFILNFMSAKKTLLEIKYKNQSLKHQAGSDIVNN